MKGNVNVMFPLSGGGSKIEGAVSYKGSVASASALPASPSQGDMYISSADFTLGTSKVESGDFLLYNGTGWDIVQGNIENLEVYGGRVTIRARNITGTTQLVFDITFSLTRNGVPYNGFLNPQITIPGGIGTYLGQKEFNNGLCTWTISESSTIGQALVSEATQVIYFSIVEGNYMPLFCFPVYKQAVSITTDEMGFVAGWQVYDYVNTQLGDVQTLLEAL